MIISKKPSFFNKQKLKRFKNMYIEKYPDFLQEEIEEKIYKGYTNNNDTINQIYCYLNIVSDDINSYKEFINIINNNFVFENILEIGAGTIPVLAKYLEDKKVNVDIIDPSIIFEDLINGNVKKEKFDSNTKVDKYDLLIGYNPCRATEDIIINAIRNKKDFCIALCGCCFLPDSYIERTPESWHKYLFELAEKEANDNYELLFIYFDNVYKIEYPILVGKRKK